VTLHGGSFSRRLVLLIAVAWVAALSGAIAPSRVGSSLKTPQVILWAWERPQDLRFIAADRVGVAYLAGSVYLEQQPVTRPRVQPLKVPASVSVMAVVRLEITKNTPSVIDEAYRGRVAQEILHLAAASPVTALQIDFDALTSQHQFYRELLQDVRRQLPLSMPLSITALGSWCMGDDWLRGLPIDEAVPMLFRMGPDRAAIVETLASGQDFREPVCRGSVGVSTDEPWPVSVAGKRVYVFHPRAWDEPSYAAVKRRLQP
jgi:hypothetical protein